MPSPRNVRRRESLLDNARDQDVLWIAQCQLGRLNVK